MVGDPRAGSGARGSGQADVGSNTHTHIKTHTHKDTHTDTHNLQATQLSLKSYPPLFMHSLGAEDSLEFSPGDHILREPGAFPRQGSGRGWEGGAQTRKGASWGSQTGRLLPVQQQEGGPGSLPLLEGQPPSAWGPG